MSIKVRSDRQNRTVHRANIDEPELLRLAVQAVADQLGVDPDAKHVHVRAYTTSYTEGSLGTSKTRIEVELTEDHVPEVVSPAGAAEAGEASERD